jgi:hypothetical protein
MIRSEHMNFCVAAEKRVMLFKGPGSFKNCFKIGGNVEELKSYRLIPLTTPLPGHFTDKIRSGFVALKKRTMSGKMQIEYCMIHCALLVLCWQYNLEHFRVWTPARNFFREVIILLEEFAFSHEVNICL